MILRQQIKAIAVLASALGVTVGLMSGSASATVVSPAASIRTIDGGVGGPAAAASISIGAPCAVTVSKDSLYVGEVGGGLVRSINTVTGRLTTVAGVGVPGESLNGAAAARSPVGGPCALAVDHSGNLLIAQTNVISVVPARTGRLYGQRMVREHLYRIAGALRHGRRGNGGPALDEALSGMYGITVDPAGDILVSDRLDGRVRIIAVKSGTRYGQRMRALRIYNLPAKDEMALPDGLAVDKAGNVVIADVGANVVRVLAVRSGRYYGIHMVAGRLYTVAGSGADGYSGDGGPARHAALAGPGSVAVDRSGDLIIADSDNRAVRVVAARSGTFYGLPMRAGDIYTVLTDEVSQPVDELSAVAVDSAGNILAADYAFNHVLAVAAHTGRFYGQPMTSGHSYQVVGNGTEYGFADCFGGYSGEAVPAVRAQFGCPEGLVEDSDGNIVAADTGSLRVRVIATRSGTFYGQAMTAGDVYTVVGDGDAGNPISGASATAVGLFPVAVAADASGNLIVANGGNRNLWVVAESTGTFYGQKMTAGDIYALGTTGLAWNSALLLDANGNIVVADSTSVGVIAAKSGTFYGVPMTAGKLYSIAGTGTPGYSGDGGSATAAQLNETEGLAIDGHGNVLVADAFNDRVRIIAVTSGRFYGQPMIAGDIYTIAGTGTCGSAGNGADATRAETCPDSLAIDKSGNVLITEYGRLQVLAAKSGTFYGVRMTANHLYEVAGNGHPGFAGDGGPLARAQFSGLFSVYVGRSGDVIVGDGLRLRMITN